MGEWMRVIDMAPPARVTGVGGRRCSKGHEMTEQNTRLRFRRRDKRHGCYWERECKKCRNMAARARARALREAQGIGKRPCRICGRTCIGHPRHGTPDGLCGHCRQKPHQGDHTMTTTPRIITAPPNPDPDPVTGLATALAYALDAFDLTLTPRANDQDEPDTEDLTALAARILGKDE